MYPSSLKKPQEQIEKEGKIAELIKQAALCIFPVSAPQASSLTISYVREISTPWCN